MPELYIMFILLSSHIILYLNLNHRSAVFNFLRYNEALLECWYHIDCDATSSDHGVGIAPCTLISTLVFAPSACSLVSPLAPETAFLLGVLVILNNYRSLG